MIRSQVRGPISWLWARYVRWAVRRSFRGVWLRGPALPEGESLLVYANHPGWWDGFAFHQLCQALGLEGHCVMEEHNLARYPFLRRLGAFSIRRGDPRSALESLGYARRVLARPRTAVLIFPQGELTPGDAAPASLSRGVEVLARRAGVRCVPLAIRYAFLDDRRPDLLLELGEAHAPAPLGHFETSLQEAVSQLAAATTTRGFAPLPGHC